MSNFIDTNRPALFVGMLMLILLHFGCGKNKVYIPPDNEIGSKIILVNAVYDPGFYVELDNKDAGFLKQRLEIRVNPGKHKLKIFNTETTLSEKTKTITHKFEVGVEVGAGEVKQIDLTWDDPSYSSDTVRRRAKPSTEKKREKSRDTRPGMGTP